MFNTIETTMSSRINISGTVYETAKSMKGTFSVDDIHFQINVQLGGDLQLSRKQVQAALSNISKCGSRLQKVNSNWYRWA